MIVVEKDSKNITGIIKRNVIPTCRVLLIEDDYVSYKLLEYSLNNYGADIVRSNSLEEALFLSDTSENFDLLIVNISLTCAAHFSAMEYLKGVFSVPVLAIDKGENKDLRQHEIVNWADCIFNLFDDTELFTETISDMLRNNTSITCREITN